MDIGVIAGCGRMASQKKSYIEYIKKSIQFAVKVGVNPIILVGRMSAENKKIIDDNHLLRETYRPEIIVLSVNDAVGGLIAAKKWIEKNGPIDTLLLCAEQSQLVNFQVDALMIDLLVLSKTTMAYGHNFPESKDNFEAERKKLLLRCLSPQY